MSPIRRGAALASRPRSGRLAAPARPIDRATFTTQLEEALRGDIVAGILRPGQKLSAAEVTGVYGVSATPVREALQRLSGEGLVDLDPKSGARVAGISLDDVRDIFAVRLLLEPRALALSMRRGDVAWLGGLAAAFERLRAAESRRAAGDGVRWREAMHESAEAHRAFHWMLLSACGSPWLLRFVSILHHHSARYRNVLAAGRDRATWLRAHEEILRVARGRKAARGVAVLERHTRDGLAMLVKAYARPRGRTGGASSRPEKVRRDRSGEIAL